MRDAMTELGPSTDVVLVTFTEPERLDHYRQMHDLPFAMLTDRKRRAYAAYGLGRGRLIDVWGPKMLRRYAEILKQDGFRGLRRPVEDTMQLGGDFVVGPDGTLVYGFWGTGPHDRPSIHDLVAAVEAAS